MKVVIPILSPALSGLVFGRDGSNPGVGGTQHVSVLLGQSLARRNPSWCVELVNQGPFLIEDAPQNLTLSTRSSINECLSDLNAQRNEVLLGTVSLLEHADHQLLADRASRVVAWSHHPYDFKLRILGSRSRLAATVSVGEYQFCSNGLRTSPHFLIHNIAVGLDQGSVSARTADQQPDTLRIGHLGALVEEKGFLDIAAAWSSVRTQFPNCELHVVGSGALYRDVPLHPRFQRT